MSCFITPVIRLEGPPGFGCPIDIFYGCCKLCGAWQISTWVKWKVVWPSVSLKQQDGGFRQHKAAFGRGEVSQLDQISCKIYVCLCSLNIFKGIVLPKINILTSFTHCRLSWNTKYILKNVSVNEVQSMISNIFLKHWNYICGLWKK